MFTHPLDHIWCPVVNASFPTSESGHRVIVMVQSPVHKVGGCSHWDVDCVRVMFLGIRSISVPSAIVLEESRVWEVVDGKDGAVLGDFVARVFMFGMIQFVCISHVLVLVSRENDGQSDDDCYQA